MRTTLLACVALCACSHSPSPPAKVPSAISQATCSPSAPKTKNTDITVVKHTALQLASLFDELRRCPKQDQHATGELVLRITTDREGNVAGVCMLPETTYSDRSRLDCVADAIVRHSFAHADPTHSYVFRLENAVEDVTCAGLE